MIGVCGGETAEETAIEGKDVRVARCIDDVCGIGSRGEQMCDEDLEFARMAVAVLMLSPWLVFVVDTRLGRSR